MPWLGLGKYRLYDPQNPFVWVMLLIDIIKDGLSHQIHLCSTFVLFILKIIAWVGNMLSYQLRVAVLGLSCRARRLSREAQISFYSCRFWGWHYSPHCLSKGSWEQLRDIACAPCVIACYPSWTWQKQLTKQASRRHRRHILDSELRTLSLSETPYTHQRKLVSAACVCNLLAVAEGASKSTALLSHSATLSLPQQTGATSSSQQMLQTSVCYHTRGNWPADTVQKDSRYWRRDWLK